MVVWLSHEYDCLSEIADGRLLGAMGGRMAVKSHCFGKLRYTMIVIISQPGNGELLEYQEIKLVSSSKQASNQTESPTSYKIFPPESTLSTKPNNF